MICERCGTQSDNSARVCPRCGAPLRAYAGEEGIASLRQGRTHTPPPVYAESGRSANTAYAQDAGRPDNRRGVTAGVSSARRRHPRHSAELRSKKPSRVNRALILTILAFLLVLALVALLVLAIRLPQGHLLLLRAAQGNTERTEKLISLIGEEESAVALWQIGQEQIDQGYVGRSIETFTRAYELNPDIDGLYSRLLALADAYEAVGQLDKAEAIYTQLYTEVDPANPLAYRYAIDILMDQGRLFEAVELMQVAYNNTKELSFKSQREQRVPLSPTSEPSAGRYMKERTVELSSPQDYDVYYLLDDAESELPEEGILYTEPILLNEGAHEIRAVCVSSELISDEVALRFTIWYPSPSAPKSRLLTGIYERPKRIFLYMEDESITGDTEGQEITIYYTIDGTTPNSDSPIYTDEGFMLTLGKYTVRAVAVNQYGKISNEYVGTYTISGKIKVLYFRDENDQFKGFTLGKTTYEEFRRTYGPGAEQTVAANTYSGAALRVTYDWGEAYFSDIGGVLYSISTDLASMTGPRNSKIGMKLDEVTALFRDMGQVANSKGNRSIYYDEAVGYARYYQDSDNSGHLDYVYWREDDGTTTLTYTLTDGKVSRISMRLDGVVIE